VVSIVPWINETPKLLPESYSNAGGKRAVKKEYRVRTKKFDSELIVYSETTEVI